MQRLKCGPRSIYFLFLNLAEGGEGSCLTFLILLRFSIFCYLALNQMVNALRNRLNVRFGLVAEHSGRV